jgi:dihydrofolate reductase
MSKVVAAAFSISIDGYGAGPGQDPDNPLGVRGPELHTWLRETETFRATVGESGGLQGIDNDLAAQSFEGVGAYVMGRNMFGPVRGGWGDYEWKGWWGDDPPFHTPVFVLTHHERDPLEMAGGTTFYFVTDGLDSALRQARAAAGDKNVRIGGGVSVVRAYLRAEQIDEIHLAISPVLLGEGEHLLGGINLPALGYGVTQVVAGENATHVLIERR